MPSRARDVRPLLLRRRAGRPQLKRDPLGGIAHDQNEGHTQVPAVWQHTVKATVPKPGPNDPVTCVQCGTTLDLASEKKRLEDEARAAIEERLRGESG